MCAIHLGIYIGQSERNRQQRRVSVLQLQRAHAGQVETSQHVQIHIVVLERLQQACQIVLLDSGGQSQPQSRVYCVNRHQHTS